METISSIIISLISILFISIGMASFDIWRRNKLVEKLSIIGYSYSEIQRKLKSEGLI